MARTRWGSPASAPACPPPASGSPAVAAAPPAEPPPATPSSPASAEPSATATHTQPPASQPSQPSSRTAAARPPRASPAQAGPQPRPPRANCERPPAAASPPGTVPPDVPSGRTPRSAADRSKTPAPRSTTHAAPSRQTARAPSAVRRSGQKTGDGMRCCSPTRKRHAKWLKTTKIVLTPADFSPQPDSPAASASCTRCGTAHAAAAQGSKDRRSPANRPSTPRYAQA